MKFRSIGNFSGPSADEHKHRYRIPKLKMGDRIHLTESDIEHYTGFKGMGIGDYDVTHVGKSRMTKVEYLNSYFLIKDTKSAKNVHVICTGSIDKLIELGIINVR